MLPTSLSIASYTSFIGSNNPAPVVISDTNVLILSAIKSFKASGLSIVNKLPNRVSPKLVVKLPRDP
jgi:hypothetical protein